jgi:arylformamidase
MKLYDISLPMSSALASWPGDVPCEFRLSWRMADGASVNVGALSTSVHNGTHTDAPFHFLPEGKTIDQLDLDPWLGPCQVVDVSGRPVIEASDLPGDLYDAPRLLLRTGGWSDTAAFPARIPVLAAGVPTELRRRGVILIGVDVPSVDQLDSKDLPIHHELGKCAIYILENLNLKDVPTGRYELIALPLRLVGADGSPVRAVLREL